MKVHKEGTGLLLTLFTIFFVVDVALYHTVGRGWVFYTTTFVTTVLFLLVLNFFRSPFRRFPFDSEGLVIAPADGTIVAIEEVMENEILHRECLQISIFMSVFNVHANWFPVNGTVKHVSHQNGRFRAAYLPKSSTENERSAVVITTRNGVDVILHNSNYMKYLKWILYFLSPQGCPFRLIEAERIMVVGIVGGGNWSCY